MFVGAFSFAYRIARLARATVGTLVVIASKSMVSHPLTPRLPQATDQAPSP